jgi:hypothetical protein
VRPLLLACLEKDVKKRLKDIGDAPRLIADRAASPAAAPPPSPQEPSARLGGCGGIRAGRRRVGPGLLPGNAPGGTALTAFQRPR